uniref:Toll-like receptor 18 n=1 Tax=Callorhinchus milii TaxID=7868 RepID=A0A4W3HCD8_CALMI
MFTTAPPCSLMLPLTFPSCPHNLTPNFGEGIKLSSHPTDRTEIRSMELDGLSQLKVLSLKYNRISWLHPKAFASNRQLEHLDLFNNSLTAIPDRVLSPLRSLRRLDMSNNLYTSAKLGPIFSQLPLFRHLSMGGSLIPAILVGDFKVLRNVSLEQFALKAQSSLPKYQPGALAEVRTESLWFDFALDKNPSALPDILVDISRNQVASVRFRNLFEFTYYTGWLDLFAPLRQTRVRNLSFFRGKFNENLLGFILKNVEGSEVRNLSLQSVDFARSVNRSASLPNIEDLVLDWLTLTEISNPEVLGFNQRFSWFSKVQALVIKKINFNYVPCPAWNAMKLVRFLDISDNQLENSYIYNKRCRYQGTMARLEEFLLHHNAIKSLREVALLTAEWASLHTIDLSNNQIGRDETCEWRQPIATLILHHNRVTSAIFKCLPTSLVHLDMSHSQLERLERAYFEMAVNLTKLLLSGNRIKFIPSGWSSPGLQTLAVDGNSFGVITKGSFQLMPSLATLRAGNNPYHCTCDLFRFVQDIHRRGLLRLAGWPEDYICYHPDRYIDTRVVDYAPGRLECDVSLVVAISVSTTAVLVASSMVLCWRFDALWYIRAAASKAFAYHAFISYSHSDANWVRGELLARLESNEPPYRICIHERDFTPGKWIIDNIIENIENSRKVIFVLSKSFVNSEWCNYELYFAHQRAIGQAFEDVVLVVIEAIKPDSLPNKFCKLRKMLDTKTYLEWPPEANRQPFFWAQNSNKPRVTPQPRSNSEKTGELLPCLKERL